MVNAAAAIGIPLLAHQGGWDEILLVAGPIILVLGLLALARRRVMRVPPSTAEPSGPDRGDPLS